MRLKERWRNFRNAVSDALCNRIGGYRCRSQVPEHEIMKLVRMYEPIITEFFDNEEEMAKFRKWREEQKEITNNKKQPDTVA